MYPELRLPGLCTEIKVWYFFHFHLLSSNRTQQKKFKNKTCSWDSNYEVVPTLLL